MITFVAFCAVLKLPLSNAWRVLLMIAIDRIDPSTLDDADRAIMIQLFGDLSAIPNVAFRTHCWRLGRGSGKTTITMALGVWRAFTADLSGVGPGMVPAAVTVAPTLRAAQRALRVARELVRSVPALEKCIDRRSDSSEGFELVRPDGRRVAIVAVAGSRGGASLRGFDVISFCLDEAEFMSSASDVASGEVHVSDRDLIAAVSARLRGAAILISTPWPTPTLTSELVDRNYGSPRDALVAIGPSLLMRPDDQNLADRVEIELARDPDTARREFFCEVTAGSGAFFDSAEIAACIAEQAPVRTQGAPCVAAMDLGFVKDASALAILERRPNGQLALVHLDQVKPTKGQPIIPSLLIARFAPMLRAHGCARVYGDTFNAEPVREELAKHGVRLIVVTESRATKAERYLALRAAITERRIILPNEPRLIAALKSIIAKPMPGGAISVSAPRRAGTGHADQVSALVLAVHAAHKGISSIKAPEQFTRPLAPRRGGLFGF